MEWLQRIIGTVIEAPLLVIIVWSIRQMTRDWQSFIAERNGRMERELGRVTSALDRLTMILLEVRANCRELKDDGVDSEAGDRD